MRPRAARRAPAGRTRLISCLPPVRSATRFPSLANFGQGVATRDPSQRRSIWEGRGKFSWRALGKLPKLGKAVFSGEDLAMAAAPRLSRDVFVAQMRQQVEEMLGRVADAINAAPPGQIITGSEEQVRDLFADLRKQA